MILTHGHVGSPTKIDYSQKNGTLILTSLLEDLEGVKITPPRHPQVLVLLSTSQGKPFWGFWGSPIFDHHSHVVPQQTAARLQAELREVDIGAEDLRSLGVATAEAYGARTARGLRRAKDGAPRVFWVGWAGGRKTRAGGVGR